MKSDIKRAEDGTITLSISVSWGEVEKARDEALDELSKQVELPGFRKGTVPKKLAGEKVGKEKVNEQTLKNILPKAYVEAVKTHKITPLINPRIHVEAFEEGTDLKFNAETCEEPVVTLKNYKDEVKKITSKSKIVIPGKEDENKKPSLEEIVKVLLANAEVSISKLLIEQEANRLLSQMFDELKTLGLSLDQYLSSRGKTSDQLRAEYEERARQDIQLEFVLRKIADSENITVGNDEINKAIAEVKDEKQRGELSQNPYLVASIIRQQKTLDFLSKI